ncbi:Carboxylic ester hydrolase [Mycena indigotica]|uniref:Carboxylic ester hydrolase n=1 Tax=Mycena indigotica TaxID=2126181 RepID=A0A8H6WHB6_9AGAR|nr:Carboxylic ester hydrolase [Mycena indigotica]KAF7314898.1 Carboxylic ester hydrolase [Mycena indigotica]
MAVLGQFLDSVIWLLVFAWHYPASSFHSKPRLSTVALDYGTFRGDIDDSSEIISFRGIRFADPPLGSLRWQPPVSPPSAHLGTVDATKFGSACIATTQRGPGATTSEDCLFGNVYIPIDADPASALPVLVFFHGGGFESGRSTKYPPEDLMESSSDPFILATFEYRLGQFGFLAGTAIKTNGALNVGLLDQKAALKWIQRYIHAFGGNPGDVTIFGQSAGAGSVVYHASDTGFPRLELIVQQLIGDGGTNDELFQQAIADSPPFLSLLDYNDPFVEDLFSQFVKNADCGKRSNDPATVACLRNASSEVLASAGRQTLQNMTSSLYPFGPVFDGVFIQERPVSALMNENFVSVPVIFGSNSDEGANWSAKLSNPSANTSNPNASQMTVYNFLAGQYTQLTLASFNVAVEEYYPISAYAGNFSRQGQQIYGEMRYICSALLVVGAINGGSGGDAAYEYHWENPILGSTHGDELVAFFNPPDPVDDLDDQLLTGMREYYTSFVTNGEPVSDSFSVEWLPTDSSELEGSPRIFLHPGAVQMEAVDRDLSARCAFWYSIADELKI